MKTVIIPTLNEEKSDYFRAICERLQPFGFEVIVADGGSTDATEAITANYGFKFLATGEAGRGARLNCGLAVATGKHILFHHPRCLVAEEGLRWFSDADDLGWGGFTHKFDEEHAFLKFTSWYSNHVRARRGILYLDHCIFARRSFLDQVGGVPKRDIFEDTELSKKLGRLQPPQIAPFEAVTSAIRFKKNGYLKQGVINQYLKIAYYLKMSDKEMNEHYEAGLSLNTDFNEKIDEVQK